MLLKKIAKDYLRAIDKLNIFHKKFQKLWFIENKPHGFDVQDIGIGGLKQRLQSCYNRLNDFCKGKIDIIEELEENLLEQCFDNLRDDGGLVFNNWANNSSINSL